MATGDSEQSAAEHARRVEEPTWQEKYLRKPGEPSLLTQGLRTIGD